MSHQLLPRLEASPSKDKQKLVYVQLVQSSGYNTRAAKQDGSTALIRVTGGGQEATLGEGDGVFITAGKEGDELKLENVGGKVGEVILFDMDA